MLHTDKNCKSLILNSLIYLSTKISNEDCLDETTIPVDTILNFITLLLGKGFGTLA